MTTLVCVPIMVDDALEALAEARDARLRGADLVEYRIDRLFHGAGDDEGADAVCRLAAESPLPCIVTCRATSEGGEYDGDDDARIALYERLGTQDRPPRMIDVELSTLERSANLRQKVRLAVEHSRSVREGGPTLIVSMHDFNARPADLLRRLSAARNEDAAAVIKIAYRARSVRDNLELFDILAERDRPTIALAMGEAGLLSRLLAPKFGGFLTFASLRDTSTTAPGQPTIDDLLGVYRFRAVGAATRVLGVIGDPVSHSLSPHVHNAGFDSVGFDAVYAPLPVPAGWEHFKATLGALTTHARLDFLGASVTIPHKENLHRYAIEHAAEGWRLDAAAARIGAANTIARDGDQGWLAANTDAPAIVECLRERMGEALRGACVGVLGAGGAARAAAAGLADAGARVVVFGRTPERAGALADELSRDGAAIEAAPWSAAAPTECDAYIHCTPIGMSSGEAPDESPIDVGMLTRGGRAPIVFETVYSPAQTPLVRDARAAGLTVIDGVEMFVRQAARQFTMWTGAPAPTALFERICRERLE